MHSRTRLARELRELGVSPGDVVMLHASCRRIGEVAGGPDEVHLAIKDALTPAGTLLMYASCPRYYDEVGRGNLTPDQEADILEHLPAFDAESARAARDNGALVEFFRTWPGSIVNNHVARFVAWGKQAEYLFSEQPWDFAFGHGSALERFTELNGKILLLGSDHDNVTYLHYAEHIGDFPGKRIARFKVPVLDDGTRVLARHGGSRHKRRRRSRELAGPTFSRRSWMRIWRRQRMGEVSWAMPAVSSFPRVDCWRSRSGK